MARPASRTQAARQARALLVRRLPGARRTTVHAHLARARAIAACIYGRWQAGPHQWRVKHLRWFLEHETEPFERSVRYRYWLTVRVLVIALGREADWLPRLQGPWTRPSETGVETSRAGRPMKRPT
jgi:hypothetical protein